MWAACVLAASCGGDDGTGGGGTASDTSSGAESTGGSGPGDDGTGPTTGSGSMGESGPPPDPELEPGSCGFSVDGFACGWANSAAQLCPEGAMAGGACDSQVLRTCCLDATTILSCQCLDNACSDQWYARDCTHGPGAGACGWQADQSAYVCGGEDGEDPSTPIACPAPDPTSFEGCEGAPLGTTCCDADGNARLCTDVGTNGNPNWQITDCALDD